MSVNKTVRLTVHQRLAIELALRSTAAGCEEQSIRCETLSLPTVARDYQTQAAEYMKLAKLINSSYVIDLEVDAEGDQPSDPS